MVVVEELEQIKAGVVVVGQGKQVGVEIGDNLSTEVSRCGKDL